MKGLSGIDLTKHDDRCYPCGGAWGEPPVQKYKADGDPLPLCNWIGHHSLVHEQLELPNGKRQLLYYDTTRTHEDTGQYVVVQVVIGGTMTLPNFPEMFRMVQQQRAAATAAAQSSTGGGSMAKLYVSAVGDRSTGLVSNKDEGATMQTQSWKGLIRVTVTPDGDFEVIVADAKGGKARKLMTGNIDLRTAVAAGDGQGVAAVAMSETLEPLHVKNRASKYAGGGTSATKTTSSAPAQSSTPKRKKASTAGAAKAATPSSPTAGTDASSAPSSTAPSIDLTTLNEGDRVELVANPDGKSAAKVGEKGTVEQVKTSGMMGPQVRVNWDSAGVGSVFLKNGDNLKKVD